MGYISGIIGSILIMEIGTRFITIFGFLAFPISVFILLIFLERIPWADFIPAVFVGAGVFFAFMSYVPNTTYIAALSSELIYCLLGLFYGFITVLLRSMYERSLKIKNPIAL